MVVYNGELKKNINNNTYINNNGRGLLYDLQERYTPPLYAVGTTQS